MSTRYLPPIYFNYSPEKRKLIHNFGPAVQLSNDALPLARLQPTPETQLGLVAKLMQMDVPFYFPGSKARPIQVEEKLQKSGLFLLA
jgi:hypothetical protein